MFQRKPATPQTVAHIAQPNQFAKQVELEQLYNKNQLIPRIRKEFTSCDNFDFIAAMKEESIPQEFGLDLLTQMALHKRANLSTMVGILKHHFDSHPNACQLTADMLLKAAEVDMVDWNPTTQQFVVRFTLSPEVQAELDLYQYPLPMVIEPKPVKCNTDSGYILGGGSLILRKNHHSDDICLDHINRVNKIKFAIDKDVAKMVKNKWRNLDKAKEGETKDKFQSRKKAFEKYDRSARAVMQTLGENTEEFYLTHKYDKRGRVYSQGYHVNYQGNPWNKAVICLADKELTV